MTTIDANLCASPNLHDGQEDKGAFVNGKSTDAIFKDRELSAEVRTAGGEFTRYLWAEIPICAQMEITAFPVNRERFILAAPLPPNRNVHGTAFAGSLYTVMSMSGWGLIRMELDRRIEEMVRARADLWLTKASIRYNDPVTTGFHAVAEAESKNLDQFWHKLVRKGRGKIRLDTFIGDPKNPKVVLQGEYAAKLMVDEMGI